MIGAGAFVRFAGELADVYEGFLPARRMRGERFDLERDRDRARRAPRRGRRVRLGDPVEVRVDGVEAPRGRVDLVPVGGARALMAKRGKRKASAGDVATNRRASHKYELVERLEAGIELQGTEVKSLREGKAQIGDAYAAALTTASCGCATRTSRPTGRRAPKTTIPSARASCSCTATRSSG